MCQLLGMNCNIPTDITFSFKGFRYRGGKTDRHKDGFGVAFFEEKGLRLYKDDCPSSISPVAKLIEEYPIKSHNIVAHIRKASDGGVNIANTHPFSRELWGEAWVFAHNGHIPAAHKLLGRCKVDYYTPIGTTDSEAIFCYLLNSLRAKFPKKPDPVTLLEAVAALVESVRSEEICNFLLSNGEWQMAHANTLLHYLIRKPPFGKATLIDEDFSIDFAALKKEEERMAVIATLPITCDEKWHQFAVNEFILFHKGEIVARRRPENPRYLTLEEGLNIGIKAGVVALPEEA